MIDGDDGALLRLRLAEPVRRMDLAAAVENWHHARIRVRCDGGGELAAEPRTAGWVRGALGRQLEAAASAQARTGLPCPWQPPCLLDQLHGKLKGGMEMCDDEIEAIRRADRRAQGITPAEDAAGEDALAHRETRLNGALTVVRLSHSRTAVVMDRVAATTPDNAIANVLILAPNEVDFFGLGSAIAALDAAFPGGWFGGDLPEAGFWGHGEPLPDDVAMTAVLSGVLPQPNGA